MRKKNRRTFIQHIESIPERRISLILVLLILIVILAIFLPVSLIGFQQLSKRGEVYDIQKETSRVAGMIDHELDRIGSMNRDWSGWDDTYHFVQDGNQEYIDDNLNADVLNNLGINLFLIANTQGEIKAFKTIDLKTAEETPPPLNPNDLFSRYPNLLQHLDENSSYQGVVTLGDQAMLITSFPILNSNREGPVMGSMIFAVYLDEIEQERLSALAGRELFFWPLSKTTLPGISDSKVVLSAGAATTTVPLDNETAAGYQVLVDIDGQPGLILQTNVQRDLYRLGNTAALIFAGIFLILCGILGGVSYQLIFAFLSARKRGRQVLERFRAVFDQSADAILLVNARGQIIDANPASQSTLDLNLDGGRIYSIRDFMTSEPEFDLSSTRPLTGDAYIREYHCVLKNGKTIDIEVSSSEIYSLNPRAYSLILRDVTARKQAQEALQISEERYQLAVRGANDGLWDWDFLADQIYYSSRWKTILGYEDDQISGSPNEWLNRIHPDDLLSFKAKLADHLNKHSENFEYEHRVQHFDGNYRWVRARGVAVWHSSGYPCRMAGSLTDITLQKQIEEQLRHDALHDALTGLANRTLMLDRLNLTNQRKRRKPDMIFALFFLDLDRFKQINDTYGHHAGDQILIETSHRLEGNLRSLDTIARTASPETLARIAGDEFVILLEDLHSEDDIAGICNRIQALISEPFLIDSNEICISASVGIVVPEQAYEYPENIIRDADIAMYRAKQQGGGNVVRFTHKMYENTVARMQLESDMRRAIERQEFELYYQPIFALNNDQVTGVEALLRWNHPIHGQMLPQDFIELAEETGLIVPIGYWVLREACAQKMRWQHNYRLTEGFIMSVNLSARQLSSPDLIQRVQAILNESSYNPKDLWLEITESTLIENMEVVKNTLKALRDLGIHIEIDDFGVGYSSLSYIQNLPVDGFKIDRSFIEAINDNGKQIVNTLVALGQDLKLVQVAEGVETSAQKDYLRTLSCEYIQGYLMARPMGPDQVEAFLQSLQQSKEAQGS